MIVHVCFEESPPLVIGFNGSIAPGAHGVHTDIRSVVIEGFGVDDDETPDTFLDRLQTAFDLMAGGPSAPPDIHTHPPADITPQGTGSGLDADLLDGKDSSEFLTARNFAFYSAVATKVTTGTSQPLSLADVVMSGKTAGGAVNGTGTEGVVAGSFASSAAETGTGSGQAALGAAAAADRPYPSADFPGQSGIKHALKKSDGDDVVLSDVLSTALLVDRDAQVYAYLSFRSDLGADLKWRLWFYYIRNSDGLEAPFTPDTSLSNVTLFIAEVFDVGDAPVSATLGRPQFGQFAADLGPGSVALTALENIAADLILGRATAGVGAVETFACTATARSLLDDATTAAMRTTLELGALAVLSAVTEATITLADVTTDNVTSTLHGFAPKSPADATKFLNGAATPAFAAIKDSDLSTTDVTTNDVTSTKHGFAPKSPADATKFLNGGATPGYSVPSAAGTAGGDLNGTYPNPNLNQPMRGAALVFAAERFF